ncbi:head GIN domain-containing protein [Mucilaginibacter pedocola]|uniref:Putative auto-transporter adhesin head GIN domain-containing protein n=1 Tax=Mucilaginibacter pedocola TaxID=1792845 RepID=A0A1S9PLB6_9SPHI|nr:head GIN domain-containing protein [Mucilaginibacter pedocola]OOQ61753.1 hypothetical protein BC343_01395 [Mucilaginibacter pedocola]
MKKLTIFCSLAIAATFAAFSASAQTVTRNVSGYTGIECNGPFNVKVKIDGTETLKLDVDADVANDIKTEVDGGVLKINLKNSWWKHRNIKRGNIYVTAKQLSYLGNGGSGNTVLEGTITGNDAKVALSGSGNLQAAVKAQNLELALSGSGGINVSGSANDTEARISGSGEINAKRVTTQNLAARISGSGSVNITANKTVSASISGSGGVDYSGSARVTETHVSGSGRVNKVD